MMGSRADSSKFLPTVRTMLINIMLEEVFVLLVLSLFESFLKNAVGQYVAYFTMLIIFTILTYLELWKYGSGDRNLVNFGRMKHDYLRGLKLGLTAALPFILYDTIFVIMALVNSITSFVSLGVFRLLNAHMMVVINSIFTTNLDLSVAPITIGIKQAIALFLIPFYIAAISGIGYFLGFRDISIISKTVYKKPQ